MPFLGIATGASRKENVSQVLVYVLLHVGPTSGEEGTGYMQQHIHVHVPEALANVVREREVVYVTLPAIPAYAEHLSPRLSILVQAALRQACADNER